MFLFAAPVWSAEKKEINTGQDFTGPLMPFDIRIKYPEFAGDFETTTLAARVDKPFLLTPVHLGY
jgi:hypothetical protein